MSINNKDPIEKVSAKSYSNGAGNILVAPFLVFLASGGIGRSFERGMEGIIIGLILGLILLTLQKRKGVGFFPKWLMYIIKTPDRLSPKDIKRHKKEDYTTKDLRKEFEQKFLKCKNNIKKIERQSDLTAKLQRYRKRLEKSFKEIIKGKNVVDINFALLKKLDLMLNSIIYYKEYDNLEEKISELEEEIEEYKNEEKSKDKKEDVKKKNNDKEDEVKKRRKDFKEHVKQLKKEMHPDLFKDTEVNN